MAMNATPRPSIPDRNDRPKRSGVRRSSISTDQATISIVGSTTISDFTELATRLYFWADWRARRARASTTAARLGPGADADPRPEAQVGEDLRAIQLDQLGALGPAVVGQQVELEPLGRPDEHHHHAGVGGGDEGVLGGQHAGDAPGRRAAPRRSSPGRCPG